MSEGGGRDGWRMEIDSGMWGLGKDRNMVGEKDQTKEISRNMHAHHHTY